MELPETVETADGLSVRGPSPELLAGLLQEFEHELSRAGVPVEQALSPGLERDQVGGIFDHLGLPVPDEIAVWFGWHNGVTSLPLWGKAFPRFEFYPIEVVESRYAREGGQPLGYSDREWNPNWIHLLGDNNGMAIECGEPSLYGRVSTPGTRKLERGTGISANPTIASRSAPTSEVDSRIVRAAVFFPAIPGLEIAP